MNPPEYIARDHEGCPHLYAHIDVLRDTEHERDRYKRAIELIKQSNCGGVFSSIASIALDGSEK